MSYLKKIIFLITAAALLYPGAARAAVSHYHELYQFDDVSGTSRSGAQWAGFSHHEPYEYQYDEEHIAEFGVSYNSTGGPTQGVPWGPQAVPMSVSGDLVYRNNPVYLHGDKSALNYPLDVLLLVIPEGIGTLPVRFGYGGGLPSVTLGVYGGNFESSYPSIVNYPSPAGGPWVSVDITVEKAAGERTVYGSSEGEIIFHQNPTVDPSQTLHVPFVIANVHDGSAADVPLDLKITTRDLDGDIVGRRWFDWDVTDNRTVPANPVDWIFVPILDTVIDNNVFNYNFETEVINHTGLRYGLQRYDDLNEQYDMDTIEPAHWKFDLQPVNDSLHYLNDPLHLHPLSHIAPGLVTFYSHDGQVNAGRQELFRLGAVDNTDEIIGSKLLTFAYRTIYGYLLDTLEDDAAVIEPGTSQTLATTSFWGLDAFRVYQSDRNFFTNALKTMEIRNTKYFFPERETRVLQGRVGNTYPPITADALSSFTMSAPVPVDEIQVVSVDATGNEIMISADVFPNDSSAMMGVNVTLRIPRANRFIAERWDDFAASRNLANDFARYFSIYFRSPSGIDLDVSKYLREESKYDRAVKVYIDEVNDHILVNYIILMIEQGNGGSTRRPMVRVVSDTSSVNDYDYVTVNDGVDDGEWALDFYVAPVESVPTPTVTDPTWPTEPGESSGSGGGGCTAFLVQFWAALALIFVGFAGRGVKRGKFFILALLFIAGSLSLTPALAAEPPYTTYEIVYETDDPGYLGTFRNAVNAINAHPTGSDEILINNLVHVNLSSPVEVSGAGVDLIIEGNGASITGNGTFRLFRVSDGANVVFRNMTFANGGAPGNGGAVLVDGASSVAFDKCTFTQNTALGYGGAVCTDYAASFTNCTFFANSSNMGGAVYGGANSTLSFSFVTMNSNTCGAVNGGQAVNAGGVNTFEAALIAGNGSGTELACSAISLSRGYNVFEDGFFQGTGHETDLTGVSALDIFGESPALHRNDAAPAWRNWPHTLALLNKSSNPALGIIPSSHITESGAPLVDQRFVVRINGSRPASAGAFEVYDPAVPVTSVEIGGVPNGIATIGFTAQLRAYALPAAADPGVVWSSSDPSVVAVTPIGRVYSLRSGAAILTAMSTGYGEDGQNVRKFVFVEVGGESASSNIPPELAGMVKELNINTLGPSGVQFYLSGGRKYFSSEAGFSQNFGRAPKVLDPLPEGSSVSSANSLSQITAIKPSVRFSAPTGTNSEAGIVPFVLSVSLSASEISSVTGDAAFSAERFFERAAFRAGESGESVIIGAGGVSAREAEDRGILLITDNGRNVELTLSGWFADAARASSVVDGQLIVSDGSADEFIRSEVWLVSSAGGSEPGEAGESSGGGCNAAGGALILLPLLWFLFFILDKKLKLPRFLRRRRRSLSDALFAVLLLWMIAAMKKGSAAGFVLGALSMIALCFFFRLKKGDFKIGKGLALLPLTAALFFSGAFLTAAQGAAFNAALDRNYLPFVMNNLEPFTLTVISPVVSADPSSDISVNYSYTWTYDSSVITLLSGAGQPEAEFSVVNAVPFGPDEYVKSVDITCTVSDGTDTSSTSCRVDVFRAGLESIEISPPKTLYLGFVESVDISEFIVYHPAEARPISTYWDSDSPLTVASVSEGVVTAVGRGTAEIRYDVWAFPADGGLPMSFDAVCEVSVLQPVLSIDISQNPSPVTVGNSGNISVSFFPGNADSKDITFSVSPNDPAIATVTYAVSSDSSSAVFNAHSFPAPNPTDGLNPVTVSVSSVSWKDYISFVEDRSVPVVIHPVSVSGVSVAPPLVMSLDVSVQLSADVNPPHSTSAGAPVWASSNPLFASVTQDGLVSAVRQGEAKISYTFYGWGINGDLTHYVSPVSAYSTVIVASPPPGVRVTGIGISPAELRLPAGTSIQLTAEITPYNATNRTVYWASDNAYVASVNSGGMVAAMNPGTTYIRATPADRGVNGNVGPAVCAVTVYDDNTAEEPALVDIAPPVQSMIQEMNSPLISEGLELNFGFMLNKPQPAGLSSYGIYPTIIGELSEASGVKIYLAEPVSFDLVMPAMEPVARSAEFEVSSSASMVTPILPVSLKMMIPRSALEKYLPGYSAEAVIQNPRQYLEALFRAFTFHKQIADIMVDETADGTYNLPKFVPLFYSLVSVLEAESLGIISLRGAGDSLEVTLNYYAADSANTFPSIIGGSLIIGDGLRNGVIHDPIWLMAEKPVEPTTTAPLITTYPRPTQGGSGGGGGCNSVGATLAELAAAAIIYITIKRARFTRRG